jgi:hypothetical protein
MMTRWRAPDLTPEEAEDLGLLDVPEAEERPAPTAAGLMLLVDQLEGMGFELSIWCERTDDGNIIEHLSIKDAQKLNRRPTRSMQVELMRNGRIIRGYVRRARSPFFPPDAADEDRWVAMSCSMADDARLRECGR